MFWQKGDIFPLWAGWPTCDSLVTTPMNKLLQSGLDHRQVSTRFMLQAKKHGQSWTSTHQCTLSTSFFDYPRGSPTVIFTEVPGNTTWSWTRRGKVEGNFDAISASNKQTFCLPLTWQQLISHCTCICVTWRVCSCAVLEQAYDAAPADWTAKGPADKHCDISSLRKRSLFVTQTSIEHEVDWLVDGRSASLVLGEWAVTRKRGFQASLDCVFRGRPWQVSLAPPVPQDVFT